MFSSLLINRDVLMVFQRTTSSIILSTFLDDASQEFKYNNYPSALFRLVLSLQTAKKVKHEIRIYVTWMAYGHFFRLKQPNQNSQCA